MSPSQRNTLHDVARRAGVSYQTVSRVINNHPYVAEKTRQRILQAIEELDYRPNRAAQSLAGTQSRTLAMTTFSLSNYGPAQMVINIEQASRKAGYDLILANVNDASLESMQTAIQHIRRWDIDGLLLITPLVNLPYSETIALCGDTPIVLMGTGMGLNVPSVVVDQYAGARAATEHLIRLGHTRICEISGPLEWFDALERHEAWHTTMLENGLTPGGFIEGDWTARSGYAAIQQLFQKQVDFTALVVGNDQMALGAIRGLRERGLRVPEDISVIGFDDIPEAAFFTPPLTTVRQDFDILGRVGIEYLIERVEHPQAEARQIVISPRLIERASTAPH